MSFIPENVKRWLVKELAQSGNPRLFLWRIQDALDEIEEEWEELFPEEEKERRGRLET